MPDPELNVRVDLAERGYDIEIGSGTLATAGEFIRSRCQAAHVVVITDKNVESVHAATVIKSLSGCKDQLGVVRPAPPG